MATMAAARRECRHCGRVGIPRSSSRPAAMTRSASAAMLLIPLLVSAARAADPPRLDRYDLLQYRDGGAVKPVTNADRWQHRRQEILQGMQQVMGPLPGDAKRVPLEVEVVEEADA